MVYQDVSCRCHAIRAGLDSVSGRTATLHEHRNKDTNCVILGSGRV